MTTNWPPLHAYAIAHHCPTCGAQPGQPCEAPKKNARLARIDQLVQRAGHKAPEHDPIERMHALRIDSGMQHYRRDVRNAPWPEDRKPGKRYDTLDQPIRRRSPRRMAVHSTVTAAPADAERSPLLQHETEIVWTEDINRLDYVRQNINRWAGTRRRPLNWAGSGRRVGYSMLAADAPNSGQPGFFVRRIFWVSEDDRSEKPDGVYRTGTPIEGVDPYSIAPGVLGQLTERAWGAPLPRHVWTKRYN